MGEVPEFQDGYTFDPTGDRDGAAVAIGAGDGPMVIFPKFGRGWRHGLRRGRRQGEWLKGFSKVKYCHGGYAASGVGT